MIIINTVAYLKKKNYLFYGDKELKFGILFNFKEAVLFNVNFIFIHIYLLPKHLLCL